MQNDTLKGRTLAMISTFMILAIGLITCGMYVMTRYYLYLFLAMTSLFLGATNLFFLLLQMEDARSKRPKKEKKKKEKKVKHAKRKKKSEEKDEEERATATEETEQEIVQEAAREETQEEVGSSKPKKTLINLHVLLMTLCVVAYVLVFYFCNTKIFSFVSTIENAGAPAVVNGVFLLLLFVIILVLDRLCKYVKDEDSFDDALLQNSRYFFKVLSLQAILAAILVVVESLQLFNIQKYIGYIYAATFYYYVIFVTISLAVIAIRKEFCTAPYLNVPIPFLKTKENADRMGFIEYLETNTGISMRSLASVKYVKEIAPMVAFVSGVLLWLSTCIVQVEPYQQAAIYRLGTLQEKILGPGIHLSLPYPFDKVELYDTETINRATIGYRAEESTDNIWTQGHDGEEFKLLLGGGDELVSINLRLEYKISNLKQYLATATAPESIMQALAYELVTDKTIATDLSSLLSADRYEFAANFRKELSDMLKDKKIGLEVVSVVLESIHPPVDVATVYQELISAEITAEKYLLYAQGNAAVKIADAEKSYDTFVGNANANNETKVAAAKSTIAEFMASVEANKENPSAYTYQKYLAAVRKAYGNANIVIVGPGIDQSMLFFGNFAGGSTGSTTTE